jgi:predicted nucleic acid-binding protein
MSKNKIVVDTNIIFKALRLPYTSLRETLSLSDYQFFAPKFLLVEIFKHKDKILSNNIQLEDDLYEYLNLLLNQISFVNEDFVSIGSYLEAYRLCKGIDEKDVPFVALAIELECPLWTYDMPLKQGLIARGFDQFFEKK